MRTESDQTSAASCRKVATGPSWRLTKLAVAGLVAAADNDLVAMLASHPLSSAVMSTQAELRCRCGEVYGFVTNASPQTVNRVVCYCDDCQAFAHQLGRADLLDARGGTDIVQVAPASLKLTQGQRRIVGVRLTPNGLFRWYASCCNTPLGNTVSPVIPFIGIVAQAFRHGTQSPDDAFGKPIAAIMGKHAVGGAPPGSTGMRLSFLVRVLLMVLGWRLRGQTWPHPYFDRNTRAPIYPLTVLSGAQREALRPLCGPHPIAHGGRSERAST
jgi:hypothetical protein